MKTAAWSPRLRTQDGCEKQRNKSGLTLRREFPTCHGFDTIEVVSLMSYEGLATAKRAQCSFSSPRNS